MMKLERVDYVIGPRRTEHRSRIVLAITGASGIVLALRLAEVLRALGHEVLAVVSKNALKVAEYECISSQWFQQKLKEYVDALFSEDDIEAPLASSSYLVDSCIVVPASIKTLALVVHGITSNLVTRAIANTLRMRRPVVAVIREAPLGTIELEILLKASRIGITIVPAVIGFYAKPQNLREIVDFIVGKILDVLGIDNGLYRRWPEAKEAQIPDPCSILFGSESREP